MTTMAAALARLLGAQGQHVEERVEATHLAVASRVFRALGPVGAPARRVHDLVADGVHASVRAAFGGAGRLGSLLVGGVPDEVLLASPHGRTVVGVVLGLVGDAIREEEPVLAWPTVLLRDGRVVADASAPRLTRPSRARELVVLLHGLCETELAWGMGTGPGRPGLPARLAAPGREVLVARVNSGLRPAEVGAEVADLLDRLVAPEVERVVFVGHSMGGLVARAALRVAARDGLVWLDRCDTLVTLGTPHLGAPLEKAVDVLVRAGAMAPEVDAITRWFDQRSTGIRDLRHGVDGDDDVAGAAVVAAPLPGHVTLHTVGAALRGPLGTLVGDGLVRPPSAHARGGRRPVRATRGTHLDVEGSHFDLLADPVVGEHVAAVVDGAA